MRKLLVAIFCIWLMAMPVLVFADEQVGAAASETDADVESGVTGDNKVNSVVDSVVGNVDEGVSDALDYISGVSNGLIRSVLLFFYRLYGVLKVWSVPIVSLSLLIGILLQVFCRRNKKVRRFGVVVFLITIPLVVLLIVFGFGTLISYLVYGKGFSAVPRGEQYNYVRELYAGDGVGLASFMVGSSNVMVLSVLIFFSVAIGVGKYLLGRYAPAQRKVGIYGFCIGLPIGLLVLIISGTLML